MITGWRTVRFRDSGAALPLRPHHYLNSPLEEAAVPQGPVMCLILARLS